MERHNETHDQRADQLAKRSAGQLTSFILKLAQEVEGVDERVEAFIVSNDSRNAAELARRFLAAFRRSNRFFDYHHSDELFNRLNQILDLIETAILPKEPLAAFRLLVRFLESDGHALESADDSDGTVGDVFRRACDLFALAAKSLPSTDVLPTLQRLLASNHYGVRDHLLDGIGDFLDRPSLEAFIEDARNGIATGGDSAQRYRWRLRSVAESMHDPVLFEEATFAGREQELPPNAAIDVARQYLDAGRPSEALEKLPKETKGLHGFASDYLELRVRILQALENAEALRPALWARFAFEPSRETLRELLGAEPADTRAARRKEALEQARKRLPPEGQAKFFAEIGELDSAASIIVGAPDKLNGDHFDGLVPLAERLETMYPLAASLIYRALLDSILCRAAPKSYRYGGRYWRIIHELSGRISDWNGLESHLAYRKRIGKDHARKTAFWRAVKQELLCAR